MTAKAFRDRDNTIYRLYQMRYSMEIVRAVERLRVTTADHSTIGRLKIPVGTALLEINRVVLTYHDESIGLRRSRVDTAHYEYLSVLGKPNT